MKKFFYYLVIILVSFSCSDNRYDETERLSDISAEAEEYGKQMAENLRFVVTQMHNNKENFNDMQSIKSAVAKYLPMNMSDSNAEPLSVADIDAATEKILQNQLTPIQIIYMEKIEEARASSKSAKEFLIHLERIMYII